MIERILLGLGALAVSAIVAKVVIDKIHLRKKVRDANIRAAFVKMVDKSNNRITLQDFESLAEISVEGEVSDDIHENMIIIGDDSMNAEFEAYKELGYTDRDALEAVGIRDSDAADEYETENDFTLEGLSKSERLEKAREVLRFFKDETDYTGVKAWKEMTDLGFTSEEIFTVLDQIRGQDSFEDGYDAIGEDDGPENFVALPVYITLDALKQVMRDNGITKAMIIDIDKKRRQVALWYYETQEIFTVQGTGLNDDVCLGMILTL